MPEPVETVPEPDRRSPSQRADEVRVGMNQTLAHPPCSVGRARHFGRGRVDAAQTGANRWADGRAGRVTVQAAA
ncbi:hypothetical protein GCM10010199_33710 [Dactylosporangium roseum]